MILATSCGGGTGRSSSSNISFKGRKADCPECKGSGLCYWCKGTGVLNTYPPADCALCWNGECQRCDGRGWILK